MVIPVQRLSLLASAVFAPLFLCQCETQRTYGEIRRGNISFDQGMWGGQGGGGTSSEEHKKITQKGYEIAEDGSIKADKPDLYADKKARGMDGKFGKKEAKFKNLEARTKEFRTPEYIKRQEYKGATEARESQSTAREGLFGNNRDSSSGKLFASKSESSTQLAQFDTGRNRAEGRTFSPGGSTALTEAVRNAPRATGTTMTAGYQDNVSMTMDDVKKMLNPGSYGRNKGLGE